MNQQGSASLIVLTFLSMTALATARVITWNKEEFATLQRDQVEISAVLSCGDAMLEASQQNFSTLPLVTETLTLQAVQEKDRFLTVQCHARQTKKAITARWEKNAEEAWSVQWWTEEP